MMLVGFVPVCISFMLLPLIKAEPTNVPMSLYGQKSHNSMESD